MSASMAATRSSIEFASIAFEEKSRCGTPVAFDRVDQPIQSLRVAAPTQTSVITLLREASSDSSTDARTGADHQTNRFHVRSLLKRAVDLFESRRPPAEWAQICGARSGGSRRRRRCIGVSGEPRWPLQHDLGDDARLVCSRELLLQLLAQGRPNLAVLIELRVGFAAGSRRTASSYTQAR